MNIVDLVVGSDDFDILEDALVAANLVTTVQNATDITVLAPDDAAFTALAVDLGFSGDTTDEDAVFTHIADTLASLDSGRDPIPLLTDILSYHVGIGALDSTAVAAASTIDTLLGTEAITVDLPLFRDLEPDLADPALKTPDLMADNGIVHVIDRVLLPLDVPGNDAPTITGLVAASGMGTDDDNTDFDILLAAVQTAGLGDLLNTDGLGATVFAPTVAAFILLAQDLGFGGSDEAGALDAIITTLTGLGAGDPLPLLTNILAYHVSPGAKQLAEVALLSEVETLQGGTFGVSGTTLVDNEPDIADPSLVATDIVASNGIVHAIDRVLLPVDIPASNGANNIKILFGDPVDGGRLRGAEDNDLLFGASARDDMWGFGGDDTFILQDDNILDIIRDFQFGGDLIDVSSFAEGISDLQFENVLKRNGDVNWVKIIDKTGQEEALVRFGDGTTLDASAFAADNFVFAAGPIDPPAATIISDGIGRDDFRGQPGAETFVMQDDDTIDVIRDFQLGIDLIDVSAFASDFSELDIAKRTKRNGDTNWIDINDDTGETEIIFRFDSATALDAANLTADAFFFG